MCLSIDLHVCSLFVARVCVVICLLFDGSWLLFVDRCLFVACYVMCLPVCLLFVARVFLCRVLLVGCCLLIGVCFLFV